MHIAVWMLLLAVSPSAVVAAREWRLRTSSEGSRFKASLLALSATLMLYLVVRFVLFPEPVSRFMTGAYVLVGILFARALQSMARRDAAP